MSDLWHDPKTALAQRAIVEDQLTHPDDVLPFSAFLWAMGLYSSAPEPRTLLDVGCGVGHYGRLCHDRFPDLRYTGTDYSPAMLAEARRFYPEGHFEQRTFFENHFSEHDIVLVSQVMEYQDAPWLAIERVLDTFKETLILHRLLWTADKPSAWIKLPAYDGGFDRNYRWNRDELEERLARFEKEPLGTDWLAWDDMLTIVVRRHR